MKKFFYIVNIFLFLLSNRLAAQVTEINLAMPTDSVGVPGDVIRMPVFLNTDVTGENIISFRLELSHYSSIKPIGVVKTGTLINSWGNPLVNYEDGKVIITAAGSNAISDTAGVLFYVDFELLTANNTSYISLYTSTGANNYFNEGDYVLNFSAGRILINEPPTLTVTLASYNLSRGDSALITISGGTTPYSLSVSDSSVAIITSGNYLKALEEGVVAVTAEDVNNIKGISADVQVRAIKLTFPIIYDVTPGDTVLVPVLINDIKGLGIISGRFSVSWDKGELVELVKLNTLLESASVEDMPVSSGKIIYTFATTNSIEGSDTLAIIKLATSLMNNGQTIHLSLNDIQFNEEFTGNNQNGYVSLTTLTTLTISGSFPSNLKSGDQVQMTYAGGTEPYTWSSSNPEVASINNAGLVTIVQGGQFIISVQDVNNQVAETSTITAYDGIFTITNGVAPGGSSYDLPLTVTAMPAGRGYSAFSMEISFDSSRLDFLQVVNTGSLSEQFTYSVNNLGNQLKIAAASQGQINAAGDLVYLRFNIKSNSTSTTYLNASNVVFNEGTPNLYVLNGSLTPGNALPVAGDTEITFDEDSLYSFSEVNFSYYQEQNISFSRIQLQSLPSTGNLSFLGSPAYVGQIIDLASLSSLNYQPEADTNGIPLTGFNIKVGNVENFSTNYGTVTINVNPVNDHPTFNLSGDVTVARNFAVPQVVSITPGLIPEDEVNQVVIYSIDPASVSFANININSSTGEVTVTAVQDSVGIQEFIVTANDSQNSNNIYSQSFLLNVTNNAPVISDQYFNIDENYSGVVDTVHASDPDNDHIVYSILSGNANNSFEIGDSTGVISVRSGAILDYETLFSYTLIVQASDGVSSNVANIYVQINDLPENTALQIDSTALVAFYNSTGGADWKRKANWLTAPLSAGWEGITITNERVSHINLAGNNLTGAVPKSIVNLSALESLDLSNNLLEELPDLTLINTLSTVNISSNKLTFEDLEPNAMISGIVYSPQDSIGQGGYFIMPANQDTTLSVSVGGTANQYQWKFNETNVGSDSNIYYIPAINRVSRGTYQVQINNTKVPSLTLYGRKATILAGAVIAGNVLNELGESLNGNAEVKLLEVKATGGYDTTGVINISANGSYSFGRVLLSDYIIVAVADTNFYSNVVPTYYPDQMEWELATPITLNEDLLTANISVIKVVELSLGGNGQISGTIFEEISTGGRVSARKRVEAAGVSVRRGKRTGRGFENLNDLELVGYTQSNSEGKFVFKGLIDDVYYLNIQYPGYPMNPNSFVEIPVGNVSGRTLSHNNHIEVEALVANNLITVTQINITTVTSDALYTDILAYPNPTSGMLYLDLSAYAKEFDVSLHDSMGKTLWFKGDASGIVSIPMAEFKQGIYLLKVQNGNKIASSMKILLK